MYTYVFVSLGSQQTTSLDSPVGGGAQRLQSVESARPALYTRSQRTPPSNTAIKTRVKTLEAC